MAKKKIPLAKDADEFMEQTRTLNSLIDEAISIRDDLNELLEQIRISRVLAKERKITTG